MLSGLAVNVKVRSDFFLSGVVVDVAVGSGVTFKVA